MPLSIRTTLACVLTYNTVVVPAARANPTVAADPFQDEPASTEVPSPEGREWDAPPPPPPPMAPEADAPAKRLMTNGVVVLGAAVGAGAHLTGILVGARGGRYTGR